MEQINPKMPSLPRLENMINIRPINEILKDIEKKEGFLRKVDEDTPPRFKGSEITDDKIKEFIFKQTFNSKIVTEYKTHRAKFNCQKGLYIYGNCGVGKTRNLYGIYRTLRANFKYDIDLEFTNITDFFSGLKQTFDDGNSEQQIIDIIKTDDILFIDDFGVEKLSEWTLEAAYRLINHRYEYMKPTFISSNLSLKEIADRMGDRFSSRIAEMCEIIKMEGEDKRLSSL